MSKEKKYLQWGYESYRDAETGEVRDDYIDLLNKQHQTIADLQAKLLEWEKDSSATLNEYRAIKYENKQLKQQLAESKKAIVNLTNVCDEWADRYIKLQNELAEKDQAIEGLQEINKSLGQTCNNDAKEIERLREELAEKEQIIKEMEQEIDGRDKRIDRLEEDYYQETRQLEWVNEQLNECEKQLAEKEEEIKELKHFKVTIGTMNGQVDISSTTYTDQDKISFALEQLELLKSQINEWGKLYKGKFSEFSNGVKDTLCDVKEQIDNQIKQLTHQHEDK